MTDQGEDKAQQEMQALEELVIKEIRWYIFLNAEALGWTKLPEHRLIRAIMVGADQGLRTLLFKDSASTC